MITPGLLAMAMLLDAALGEPDWLWQRWPHPAVLIGRVISWLDHRLNSGTRRRGKGVAVTALLVAGAAVTGRVLAAVPDFGVIEVIVAAILLAQNSLARHVRAVARALDLSLGDGRRVVAMIVGRDTGALDAPGVARAAIESAAENFSDGVIAPAFWFLVAGLPGILICKAVNTADSMIGHMSDRYRDFGWAAARLDDLLNWVPARISAALILLVFGKQDRWRRMARDAALHRSPNAGWPESAMAQVLGVALAGPRSYGGQMQDFPFVNEGGRRDPGPRDIDASVAVLWRAWGAVLAAMIVMGGLQ